MEMDEEPAEDYGAEGEVAAALYAKHRHSTSPESQQLCTVLEAVLSAVAEQELPPSATAIFAAALSSLRGLEGAPEVRARSRRSRCSPAAAPLAFRLCSHSLLLPSPTT